MTNQFSSNREAIKKIEVELNQEVKENLMKYGYVSNNDIYRKVYKKLGMDFWPDVIGFEGEIKCIKNFLAEPSKEEE